MVREDSIWEKQVELNMLFGPVSDQPRSSLRLHIGFGPLPPMTPQHYLPSFKRAFSSPLPRRDSILAADPWLGISSPYLVLESPLGERVLCDGARKRRPRTRKAERERER